jgi:hypothetical protein
MSSNGAVGGARLVTALTAFLLPPADTGIVGGSFLWHCRFFNALFLFICIFSTFCTHFVVNFCTSLGGRSQPIDTFGRLIRFEQSLKYLP